MAALAPRVEAPRPVVVAVGIAALEGSALVALAVLLVVKTATSAFTSLVDALGGAALALIGAAVLLGLAPYVLRCRRWARTPIVLLQALWLPIGFSLAFQGGRPEFGLPVLVAAVAVLGLLFGPAESRAAFL